MRISTALNNNDQVVVSLLGRLDANSTKELGDVLSTSLDRGYTNILIDCTRLSEVSSAGLDFLIENHNKFKEFDGTLTLRNASHKIENLLNKSNLDSIINERNEVPTPYIQNRPNKLVKVNNTIYKYFKLQNLNEAPSLEAFGNPDKLEYKEFFENDPFLIKYNKNTIGLGLGTLSYDLNNSQDSFGEYLNIGSYTFHIPPNKNNLPDYQKISNITNDNQFFKVNALYGLRTSNIFNNFATFSNDFKYDTNLSDLIYALMNFVNAPAISFVICANINSLCGIRLINPIFSKRCTNIFEKSCFNKNFKYISANEYKDHSVIVVGFAINQASALIRRFLKPYDLKNSIYAHMHSLIFKHQHLCFTQQNTVNEIISAYIRENTALDLCHLINDDVKKSETAFTDGICYFNSLKEFKTGEF